MKGFIVVDPYKCLACRSCELQCAVEHSKSKKISESILEESLARSRIKVEVRSGIAVPLQCRHCEGAACIIKCPTKALKKAEAEGPVILDEEKCVGCGQCVLVCPFGVIRMEGEDKGKKLIKCDLCFERTGKGKIPACAQGCPTAAITFKPEKEALGKKRKRYLVTFTKDESLIFKKRPIPKKIDKTVSKQK